MRGGTRKNRRGQVTERNAFQFDQAVCKSCPLRVSCVKGKSGKGRSVALHPQEALLQEARAFQRSPAYAPYRALRQVVDMAKPVAEHRIARLMQLGARKARYSGREKTLFQLLMAATVANLTLVATKTALMRGPGHRCGEATGGRNAFSFHFSRVFDAIRAFMSRFSMAFKLGGTFMPAENPVFG